MDGQPTDFATLTRLGEEGVLLLLSDCVHVETPGHTPSEMEVGRRSTGYIRDAPGRVIIATFGSLISRVQHDPGHRLSVTGARSRWPGAAWRITRRWPSELGYLDVPPDTLISVQDVKRYRRPTRW